MLGAIAPEKASRAGGAAPPVDLFCSVLALVDLLQHLQDVLRQQHRIDHVDHAVVGLDVGADDGRLAREVRLALDLRLLLSLALPA
jgi:hypothetical protein